MKKLATLLIASSLALTACPTAPTPPPPQAQVRFVHASNDAGNVDLFLNTAKINTNPLPPKTTFPTSIGYTPITWTTSALPKLEVCVNNSTNCPIKPINLALTDQATQTVLIVGSFNGTGTSAPGTAILTDNNAPLSTGTNFRLRIVNAYSPAANLKVYITGQNDAINSAPPITVDYKSAIDYFEKPANITGGYRIRATDTTSATPIIDTNISLAFTGGKVYTFLILGPTADSVLLTDK